jgi:hypothetical protein
VSTGELDQQPRDVGRDEIPAPDEAEQEQDRQQEGWQFHPLTSAHSPAVSAPALPDELRLRRARKRLAEFGTLWRNPAVPDRLREEALHEIFAQVDVQGSQLLAVHPQPNENAWLLGLVALRQEQHVGMVGARGIPPSCLTQARSCGSCA